MQIKYCREKKEKKEKRRFRGYQITKHNFILDIITDHVYSFELSQTLFCTHNESELNFEAIMDHDSRVLVQ